MDTWEREEERALKQQLRDVLEDMDAAIVRGHWAWVRVFEREEQRLRKQLHHRSPKP